MMQKRRRCRRYFVNRTSVLWLTIFSTFSTMILIHKYFSRTSIEQENDVENNFIVDENDLLDANIKPTKNIYLLHEEYFNATHLSCRYPKLTIDNPEIWKHLQPVNKPKPDCEKATNWVYVDNGLFNNKRNLSFFFIEI